MGSVNAVGTYGGLVIGAVIGGLPGRALGVTAPFWFAFSLDSRGCPLLLAWRAVSNSRTAVSDNASAREQYRRDRDQ